jgi:hypothetical protein
MHLAKIRRSTRDPRLPDKCPVALCGSEPPNQHDAATSKDRSPLAGVAMYVRFRWNCGGSNGRVRDLNTLETSHGAVRAVPASSESAFVAMMEVTLPPTTQSIPERRAHI